MEKIDKLHLEAPAAGNRRMFKYLRRLTGKQIGRRRGRRLMRVHKGWGYIPENEQLFLVDRKELSPIVCEGS